MQNPEGIFDIISANFDMKNLFKTTPNSLGKMALEEEVDNSFFRFEAESAARRKRKPFYLKRFFRR